MLHALGPGVLVHDSVVYVRLEGPAGDSYKSLQDLQEAIWGVREATPSHQFIAAHTCGGVVVGAFAQESGGCVGFSYAFPAHDKGRSWLHSHQTGVRQSHRDRNVGSVLKWLQRSFAVAQGYDLVTWTYDPLEARNAYFNLSKLRATATDYKTDYYGSMTGGPAAGLPTDRLWMEWAVKSPGVSARFELFLLRSGISWPSHIREVDLVQGAIAADVEDFQEPCSVFEPLEVRDGILAPPPETMLELDSPSLSVEVPTSLRAVRDILGHKDALYWRLAVRKAFQTYLQSGYTATGFQRREGGGRYLLVQRGREKIPRRS